MLPFKTFNNFVSTLPVDVAKVDSHEFPAAYMLSALTNKFVSSIRVKNNFNSDLYTFLCEHGEMIRYREFQKEQTRDSVYFFYFKNSIIAVNKSEEGLGMTVYCTTDNILDTTIFDKFKDEDKSSKVSILVKSSYGLETRSIKVDTIVVDDMNLNYGPNFDKVHSNVVAKLDRQSSGIMFFHGPAGCGKSSYIKYLTTVIDKEFIFIPVAFAGELSSPDFMSLLLDHKDSILILEDAEKVVQSRDVDDHNVSTVSTLLNISDGILGSMLNIKIIATYNGEKDKVDKALLRPGRLAVDHTFGKLDANTATKLAQKLGKNITFNTEMSLAEVYNIGDETGYKEKQNRKIGFGV